MNKPVERPGAQVHDIRHYINGREVPGTSNRYGDVYNPALGEVGEPCGVREHRRGRAGSRRGAGRLPCVGRNAAAASRTGHVQVQGTDRARSRQAGAPDLQRARQGRLRCARRSDARPGGGRVRLRHSAPAQRRIQRAGRHRCRQLFDASAARRVRRHHAVQLPGHGPDVDVPGRHRLRQHLRAQTLRARSLGQRAISPGCSRKPVCPTACSTSCTATKWPSTRC